MTVGRSEATDVAEAAREAVAGALEGAENPALGLVFSTEHYDHEALARAVGSALGRLPWAGCCTAGVFTGHVLLKSGIAVGVISSPDVKVGIGAGGPVSEDAHEAGRAAVAAALAALPSGGFEDSGTLIVLPDALTGDAAEVVRGAAEEAGAGVVWAGGGAGDNLRFIRTAQYANGRAFHDHVVVVAVDSRRPSGSGLRHGWHPYGPPAMVTKARGAVAMELDYERAFDVYQAAAERQGDAVSPDSFPRFAMTHPLGIPQADGSYLIRDPLAVEEDGSLRCVADVPDGSLVRVMVGTCEDLVQAATEAASLARSGVGGNAGGAVIFDCVSRSLMLESNVEEELRAFGAGLGSAVPILGCLTFGEVGAAGSGVPQFHNKTAVVLALPT